MHENQVKEAVIGFLLRRGFVLYDNAAHLEHGLDILMRNVRYGRFLCIEAKGDGGRAACAPGSGRETRFLISLGQVLTRMRPRTGYHYGLAYPDSYRTLVVRRIDHEVLKVLRIRLYFVDRTGAVEEATWRTLAQEQAHRPRRRPRGKPRIARMSGLAAAATILRGARRPMSVDQLAHQALALGLWRSRGRTPGATLSAAIRREVTSKGRAARFRQVAPGRFVATRPGSDS
jgi:hypothetical protein